MSKGPILVCHRVMDLSRPHVLSHMSACTRCGFKVWVAFSSPKSNRRWCMHCARDELADQPTYVQISAFPEQIRDLQAYFASKRKPQ